MQARTNVGFSRSVFWRSIIFVTSAMVWFGTPLVNGNANAQALADEHVRPTMTANGLTVEQVKGLHAKFGLSNDAINHLPKSALQPMLWQVAHPKVDLHTAANHFRLLKLRDEHGQIP